MENGELALLRTLMDKDFYDSNKGIHTPDKLFTKDVRKVKRTIDYAMNQFDKDLNFSELEGLFFTRETLTTANKDSYKRLFDKLRQERPMNQEVAQAVMSNLFQQVVGEEVANLGFDYVNGEKKTFNPLGTIRTAIQLNFIPELKVAMG